MVVTILLVQYSISLYQRKPFQGVEHFCKEPFENFVTALSRQILRGTSRHNNLTNFCHRFLGSPENDSTGAGHFRIVTRVFFCSPATGKSKFCQNDTIEKTIFAVRPVLMIK